MQLVGSENAITMSIFFYEQLSISDVSRYEIAIPCNSFLHAARNLYKQTFDRIFILIFIHRLAEF